MRGFSAGLLAAVLAVCLALPALAQSSESLKLKPGQGDVVLKNFRFGTGETLAELKLHYTTLGKPKRDRRGRITNAVMILHGTGGDGTQFLQPQFAGILFRPDGLLDPANYFIVLPDSIGHGRSSRPSDGMHASFPHYDYDDMVRAQYEVLNELKIKHLRLVMGTSMGCMHAFVWAETYPNFMDAVMPLACLPVEISGRNRLWRKMIIDAIVTDPDWMSGEYKTQPQRALRTASNLLTLVGSAPLQMQKSHGTRELADAYAGERSARDIAGFDANDLLYQVSASRNYDPSPKLGKIKARVMWVNSADDFVNPPELGIAEEKVKEIKNAKFVLLPVSEETRGHGSHSWAALWMQYLDELLQETEE